MRRTRVKKESAATYGALPYTFVRSGRRTWAVEVKADGAVYVRAPLTGTRRQAEEVLASRMDWIRAAQARMKARRETQDQNESADSSGNNPPLLSEEEINTLKVRARSVFPARTAYYAPQVGSRGVTYGRITIRCQRSRWGSCSSKGNLNYNCLLILAPPQVLDYVVVHELCHRLYMNHSSAFWQEVERILPEYRNCERWLKKNGKILMRKAIIRR